MTRLNRVIGATVAVTVLGLLYIMQPSSAAARGQGGTREVKAIKGINALSLLREGDKELVLVSQSLPPDLVWPPPGTSMAEWSARFADFVLLVRVKSKESLYSETFDWITTAVRSEVVEALKV